MLNLQGDVIRLITTWGETAATYQYDAWGNIISTSGYMASVNPIRYRGYYYDTETGFYYLQSRYYDPSIVRFINADSFASTGQNFIGYNMFAYCNNNPIIFPDQTRKFLGTVFDVGTLIVSAYELAANPTDFWALASFSADLVDVLLPVVSGLGEAVRAFKTADSISEAVTYTAKVYKQMNIADDAFHNFPLLIDLLVDTNDVRLIGKQADGCVRMCVQAAGEMIINGKVKQGVYEYIMELSGACNHRFFRELK